MIRRKHRLVSFILTLFVVSILFLSGPASAIDVALNTPNVVGFQGITNFSVTVTIYEGEFLPILYTDLVLDGGVNSLTCRINKDDTTNCDFLTVISKNLNNLNEDYGAGYGYGYNSAGELGNHEFGSGYGYGPVSGTGEIVYSLEVDNSKLPGQFFGKNVNVEAIVYGGDSSDVNHFKGKSSFQVTADPGSSTSVTPGNPVVITYEELGMNIPVVPVGVNLITVQQVSPTVNPNNGYIKQAGKVFNFGPEGTIFDQPVIITIPYTDIELSLAGVSESQIYIAYYDSGDWVRVSGTINPVLNTITFETDHFSQFAVLGDATPASGGDSSPSSVSEGLPPWSEWVKEQLGIEEAEEEEVVPVAEETTEEVVEEKGLEAVTGEAITGAVVGGGESRGVGSTIFWLVTIIVLIVGISYLIYNRKDIKRKLNFMFLMHF